MVNRALAQQVRIDSGAPAVLFFTEGVDVVVGK